MKQFILRSEATKDLALMCAAQVGARSLAALGINS